MNQNTEALKGGGIPPHVPNPSGRANAPSGQNTSGANASETTPRAATVQTERGGGGGNVHLDSEGVPMPPLVPDDDDPFIQSQEVDDLMWQVFGDGPKPEITKTQTSNWGSGPMVGDVSPTPPLLPPKPAKAVAATTPPPQRPTPVVAPASPALTTAASLVEPAAEPVVKTTPDDAAVAAALSELAPKEPGFVLWFLMGFWSLCAFLWNKSSHMVRLVFIVAVICTIYCVANPVPCGDPSYYCLVTGYRCPPSEQFCVMRTATDLLKDGMGLIAEVRTYWFNQNKPWIDPAGAFDWMRCKLFGGCRRGLMDRAVGNFLDWFGWATAPIRFLAMPFSFFGGFLEGFIKAVPWVFGLPTYSYPMLMCYEVATMFLCALIVRIPFLPPTFAQRACMKWAEDSTRIRDWFVWAEKKVAEHAAFISSYAPWISSWFAVLVMRAFYEEALKRVPFLQWFIFFALWVVEAKSGCLPPRVARLLDVPQLADCRADARDLQHDLRLC